MESFLKKTGGESIATSVVFALIGIMLIFNPEETFKIATAILGVVLIGIGIVKVVNYYKEKGTSDFYNYKLVSGLIAIIAGIVIIVYGSALGTFFRLIIGIWIIYSGIMRLALATKLKAADVPSWQPVLIVAILMLLCGAFITFYSGAIVFTIGVIILMYALMDLFEGIIFVKNVDKVFKEEEPK